MTAAERVDTVACDFCGDTFDPAEVEPCPHGWWTCGQCHVDGCCRYCSDDIAAELAAEVAADERRGVA